MKANRARRLNALFRKSQELSRIRRIACKSPLFELSTQKRPAFCGPFQPAAASGAVVMLRG